MAGVVDRRRTASISRGLIPPRRSQEERRETTRNAILDATIFMLVKHGYANLTTESVVRHAGVTRGAHAHYFSSKADLLVQALDRLATQMRAEAEQTLSPVGGNDSAGYEAILDRLWEVHRGALFTAATELHVAARTDKELRVHLQRFDRDIAAHIVVLTIRYLPNLVVNPNFEQAMTTVLAAMRGVALLGFTASAKTVDRVWEQVRGELIRAGESELVGEPGDAAAADSD